MSLEQIFGKNLRALRLEKGWSQEELAEACHIDRTYVSGVERGVRNPTLRVVEQFASGLGVPASAFFCLGQNQRGKSHK
jgi:transcriptional regulator with XRE-family HTH domain